ncbi:hypothetical protein BaRGS_00025106 [Batillaria attramentaria]|uniref:Secreted protein n=1 Tax=Batillaria attramentaria TaxID=370345 RepID=A0ABD0K9B0_9CAEN
MTFRLKGVLSTARPLSVCVVCPVSHLCQAGAHAAWFKDSLTTEASQLLSSLSPFPPTDHSSERPGSASK